MSINASYQSLKSKIIPVEPQDLKDWRNWYAKLMIMFIAIGLPLHMIASLPQYISDENYSLIVLNAIIWIIILFRVFIPGHSYQANVYMFFAILYLWMISLFVNLGLFHGRPAWLIMGPVLAAMLFGIRAAIISVAVNTVILMVLYALMGPENPVWASEYAAPFGRWISFVVNVSILALATSIPVGYMLQKLDRSLKDERKLYKEISAGNEKLKAAEERYRDIFENAVEGIFQSTPEGSFITVNTSLANIFGYPTPEECITHIKDIGKQLYVKPEKREAFIAALKKNNTVKEFKAEVYRRDGSTAIISVNARAVRKDDGRILYMEGFVQDITHIMKAEKILKESEKKYRLFAENVSDVIWTLDMNLKTTYISPSVERARGYTVEEVMAQKAEERLTTESLAVAAQVFAEELEIENKRDKDLQRSRMIELEFLHKDGSTRWSEVRLSIIRNTNGKATGFLGVSRDITERKRSDEKLLQEKNFTETVINSLPGTFYVYNENYQLIKWNKKHESITGYTAEELYLKPQKEFFDSKYEEEVKRFNKKVMDEGEATAESYVTSKDGRKAVFNFSATRLIQGDKKYHIGVGFDITDRKKAEKEKKALEQTLQQSQKMEAIGTLAGGIAHDFNNILSAIIGYTELSQMDLPKENRVSGYLEQIMKAGNRAKDLVQQILTFSRQTEQELKPVSVKVIVKEALKLLRATLPTTIHIESNIQSDSLVMGDPTQIHQLLMNLCTNAGHAMQEKGGILGVDLANVEIDPVFASRHLDLKPGPYLNLTVSDTGHGMPPGVLDRIFDPFFSTKEKGQGTGMGLAVVHGIVKSFGGTIYAYSEPGTGSSFKVFLPAVESSLEPDKKAEEVIPRGTERILFIDDEIALVDMGKQTLESLGYKVASRTSSVEALNLFRAQPGRFDLVITDMTMPQMTGDKLAGELIAIRKDIPVILCTGFSYGMTEEKAKEMGIKGFLMKPFVLRDLANKVRKVLDDEIA